MTGGYSNMNPVGYVYDYAIYHPECFPKGVDRDNPDEVGAIFAWDKDACSTCDVCFEPLIECDSNSDSSSEDDDESEAQVIEAGT